MVVLANSGTGANNTNLLHALLQSLALALMRRHARQVSEANAVHSWNNIRTAFVLT